ncbi:hypothetical protein DFP93_102103 [Aneurinibacillus soli]|uniref:Putative zinc-ribbon domain-containing protein n=1 Tax=Aneurinibacillus soli TaxID=1500254 RepID=A0A0U5AV88_9BACL|nr:hypothetical protein DFP93_102103 [Aneurinibacillus soli]BAU27649.1 hypothetical protein CB4_01823 [Aneurinibacillus soli]
MVPCKVCKKEVAKSAITCPHCGAKLKMHPAGKFFIGCLGIIGITICALLFYLYVSYDVK